MTTTRSLTLLLATGLVACSARLAPMVTLTPRAAAVLIRKADPPPAAQDLGPISAAHGYGCGAGGQQGSYDGAMAALRNAAATRGANYVQIVFLKEPYLAPYCFHNEYIIRGLAFKVTQDAAPGSAKPASPPTGTCTPPCSPGYSCSEGVCAATCNPACSPGFVCAQDRTCRSSPSTSPGAPPMPQSVEEAPKQHPR